jgi:hypothetical protein
MAVENPLGWVVGIGEREAGGVFFFGCLCPVVEVEGDFDQSGACYINFLVYLSNQIMKLI